MYFISNYLININKFILKIIKEDIEKEKNLK